MKLILLLLVELLHISEPANTIISTPPLVFIWLCFSFIFFEKIFHIRIHIYFELRKDISKTKF